MFAILSNNLGISAHLLAAKTIEHLRVRYGRNGSNAIQWIVSTPGFGPRLVLWRQRDNVSSLRFSSDRGPGAHSGA